MTRFTWPISNHDVACCSQNRASRNSLRTRCRGLDSVLKMNLSQLRICLLSITREASITPLSASYNKLHPLNTLQSPFSTSLILSAFSFLLCLPFSLQGKCNTGTKKKVLPLSAIPANIFHQAIKAATMPKAPPARFREWLGVVTPLTVVVYM
jgi:hypothetical protein